MAFTNRGSPCASNRHFQHPCFEKRWKQSTCQNRNVIRCVKKNGLYSKIHLLLRNFFPVVPFNQGLPYLWYLQKMLEMRKLCTYFQEAKAWHSRDTMKVGTCSSMMALLVSAVGSGAFMIVNSSMNLQPTWNYKKRREQG